MFKRLLELKFINAVDYCGLKKMFLYALCSIYYFMDFERKHNGISHLLSFSSIHKCFESAYYSRLSYIKPVSQNFLNRQRVVYCW